MNRISAPSCPGAASPPEGDEFQTMIRPKRDDHRTALIVLIRDASAIVAGGAPASASAGAQEHNPRLPPATDGFHSGGLLGHFRFDCRACIRCFAALLVRSSP